MKITDTVKKVFKPNPSFTLKEQLGFASGLFGNAMGQDTVNTYADQFMYDFSGLSASRVTTVKMTSKIINLCGVPVIGRLLDRPAGKHGSARPFLLGAPIPFSIMSVLLFIVPESSVLVRTIWDMITFFVFSVSDSCYDMSILTVSSRMTTNPNDRKNFYTVAEFASTLGSMLPGWILPILVDMHDETYSSQKWTYFFVALFFSVCGLVTMIIPYFTLREKVAVSARSDKEESKISWRTVLTNKPLILLTVSQMIDSIRQVCYKSLPYFYKQTIGKYSLKSVTEMFSGALSYVGLAAVPWISKNFAPRDIISYGYMYTGLSYAILLLVGYKHNFVTSLLLAVGGMPSGAMRAARKILLADSADYMEWKTYHKYGVPVRADGMVFAANSVGGHISGMWQDLLFNAGLALIGYKSASVDKATGKTIEAVQTPETLKGIFYLVTIPGIVGNIVPGLIMLFDDFRGDKRKAILEELRQLHESQAARTQDESAGARADVDDSDERGDEPSDSTEADAGDDVSGDKTADSEDGGLSENNE